MADYTYHGDGSVTVSQTKHQTGGAGVGGTATYSSETAARSAVSANTISQDADVQKQISEGAVATKEQLSEFKSRGLKIEAAKSEAAAVQKISVPSYIRPTESILGWQQKYGAGPVATPAQIKKLELDYAYAQAQKRQEKVSSYYSSWKKRSAEKYEEMDLGVATPLKRIPQGVGEFSLGMAEMAHTVRNIGQTAYETKGDILGRMYKAAPRAIAETPKQLLWSVQEPFFKYGTVGGGMYNLGQLGSMAVLAKGTARTRVPAPKRLITAKMTTPPIIRMVTTIKKATLKSAPFQKMFGVRQIEKPSKPITVGYTVHQKMFGTKKLFQKPPTLPAPPATLGLKMFGDTTTYIKTKVPQFKNVPKVSTKASIVQKMFGVRQGIYPKKTIIGGTLEQRTFGNLRPYVKSKISLIQKVPKVPKDAPLLKKMFGVRTKTPKPIKLGYTLEQRMFGDLRPYIKSKISFLKSVPKVSDKAPAVQKMFGRWYLQPKKLVLGATLKQKMFGDIKLPPIKLKPVKPKTAQSISQKMFGKGYVRPKKTLLGMTIKEKMFGIPKPKPVTAKPTIKIGTSAVQKMFGVRQTVKVPKKITMGATLTQKMFGDIRIKAKPSQKAPTPPEPSKKVNWYLIAEKEVKIKAKSRIKKSPYRPSQSGAPKSPFSGAPIMPGDRLGSMAGGLGRRPIMPFERITGELFPESGTAPPKSTVSLLKKAKTTKDKGKILKDIWKEQETQRDIKRKTTPPTSAKGGQITITKQEAPLETKHKPPVILFPLNIKPQTKEKTKQYTYQEYKPAEITTTKPATKLITIVIPKTQTRQATRTRTKEFTMQVPKEATMLITLPKTKPATKQLTKATPWTSLKTPAQLRTPERIIPKIPRRSPLSLFKTKRTRKPKRGTYKFKEITGVMLPSQMFRKREKFTLFGKGGKSVPKPKTRSKYRAPPKSRSKSSVLMFREWKM